MKFVHKIGFVLMVAMISLSSSAFGSIEDLRKIQQTYQDSFEKQPVTLTSEEKYFFQAITTKLKKSPLGEEMLKTAEHLKFQFAGFAKQETIGVTSPEERTIRIANTDIGRGVLILAHELGNAIQFREMLDIRSNAKAGNLNREEYASEIIRTEAASNYWMNLVANDLNLSTLAPFNSVIKEFNQKLTEQQAIDLLVKNLEDGGFVKGGKSRVKDFYMQQYDLRYQKSWVQKIWGFFSYIIRIFF